MTEALEKLRETVRRATPGPWRAKVRRGDTLCVIRGKGTGNPVVVETQNSHWHGAATQRERANATHIVLADSLARLIADPETVEREGEQLYGAFWKRNEKPDSPPVTPFADQADAIRQMWFSIAADGLSYLAERAQQP